NMPLQSVASFTLASCSPSASIGCSVSRNSMLFCFTSSRTQEGGITYSAYFTRFRCAYCGFIRCCGWPERRSPSIERFLATNPSSSVRREKHCSQHSQNLLFLNERLPCERPHHRISAIA